MEVESRVIAAALEVLNITSIEDIPDEDHFPSCLPEESAKQKRTYIENLATIIVDKYVLQLDKVEDFLQKCKVAKEGAGGEGGSNKGRFQCRFPGCSKTFKHDGSARQKHEGSHGEKQSSTPQRRFEKALDDMYNYQLALLDYGMIAKNFFNAISEGDGESILRTWKFMLLYLKVDGKRSSKYGLEAFYILCQANCLLSPRAAYNLIWNRFTKTQNGLGGNIPLDLSLEHFNRILKNVLRMLGSNASSPASVDRYCKALATTKRLLEQWDASSRFIQQSGKHRISHAADDMLKIIKQLMADRALKYTPGRKYKYYRSIKSSIIEDLDISSLFEWINEHRRLVKINKIAR